MVAVLFVFAIGLMPARAEEKIWNTTTNDWFVDGNWSPEGVPAAGDDVVVTNSGALVRLTNSTFQLSSMIISNATLSFSNWNTMLYVTNLTIRNDGVLTCLDHSPTTPSPTASI